MEPVVTRSAPRYKGRKKKKKKKNSPLVLTGIAGEPPLKAMEAVSPESLRLYRKQLH